MRPARLLMAFLVSVLALTASAEAQSKGERASVPQQRPAPPSLAKAHIVGTVTCSDTRQPARGARLMLMPLPTAAKAEDGTVGGRQIIALVGVDGTFSLEHVAAGDYILLGFLPGYTSPLDSITSSDEDKQIDQAAYLKKLGDRGVVHVGRDGTTRIDLVLERGAAVSGHVVYADGAPATQVAIELEDTTQAPSSDRNGERSVNLGAMMRTFFNHQNSGTDDLGNFRIAGISPATYRLAVLEAISAPANGSDEMSMMMGAFTDPHATRIYAGDTPHRKAAKVFELHAGDEVSGIEIRLPIDGFHTVNGTVTATDGRAVNMGRLTLTDTADDTLHYSTALGIDGTFAIPRVPPGTYTLAAKDAHIGEPPPGLSPAVAGDQRFFRRTHAFAEASVAVIVKEGDVSGADLSLKEVPMPVNPAGPIEGDQNPDQKIVPAAPED